MALLGNAEHLGDDHGGDHGEVGHDFETDRTLGQRGQQLVDHLVDAGLPLGRRAAREQRYQGPPEALMLFPVHRDHVRRLVPREDLQVAAHHPEPLPVRQHGAAIVETGDHPRLYKVVPHDAACGPDPLVERKGVLHDGMVKEVDVQAIRSHFWHLPRPRSSAPHWQRTIDVVVEAQTLCQRSAQSARTAPTDYRWRSRTARANGWSSGPKCDK